MHIDEYKLIQKEIDELIMSKNSILDDQKIIRISKIDIVEFFLL